MQLFILQRDSVHQGSIIHQAFISSLHYDCEFLLTWKGNTKSITYIYLYINT